MKRIYSILVVFALGMSMWAFEVDGVIYNAIDGTHAEAISVLDGVVNVTIPEVVEDNGDVYEVVSIAAEFMKNQVKGKGFDVRKVVIGDNVKTINASAFESCTRLDEIVLGNGIEVIGNSAFRNCSKVLSFDAPSTLREIGDLAFSSCSQLKSVVLNEGLVSIGKKAFYDSNALTGTIEIPSSVTSVGSLAFSTTSITKLILGSDVAGLGSNCFADCSALETVELGSKLASLPDSLFMNCSKLASIVISASVKKIGKMAFYKCTNLKDVVVEEGLTTVGTYAFRLSGLEKICLPNTVTTLEQNAFYDCQQLRKIVLGTGVEVIDRGSFKSCTNLTEMFVLGASVPECASDNVFYLEGSDYGTENLKIYVPTDMLESYYAADYWSDPEVKRCLSDKYYTVTYDLVGGENASDNWSVYSYGNEIQLQDATKEGYKFLGWYDELDNKVTAISIDNTGDVVLKAKWEEINDNPGGSGEEGSESPITIQSESVVRVYAINKTIEVKNSNASLISVYNLIGNKVYEGTNTSIPVGQNGIYIVKVGTKAYKTIVK